MKKNVYDYFLDFESKLNKKEKMITSSNSNILELPRKPKEYLKKLSIDGTPVYTKNLVDEQTMFGIISSKMYNDLGILNPPVLPLKKGNDYKTFTQDLKTLKNLEITQACDVPQLGYLHKHRLITYKWQVLHNQKLRDYYLSFMTEECFNELVSLFLVDELKTDNDRHNENFFLYKKRTSDKYEGVFAIDMDECLALTCTSKENFRTFLNTKITSNTPSMGLDCENYKNRIRDIKDLINDGDLTKTQIDLLKNTITYDLPTLSKNLCKKYEQEIYLPDIYEQISRLWEYNYNSLKDDLSI